MSSPRAGTGEGRKEIEDIGGGKYVLLKGVGSFMTETQHENFVNVCLMVIQ